MKTKPKSDVVKPNPSENMMKAKDRGRTMSIIGLDSASAASSWSSATVGCDIKIRIATAANMVSVCFFMGLDDR